jgi:hypothetical protein
LTDRRTQPPEQQSAMEELFTAREMGRRYARRKQEAAFNAGVHPENGKTFCTAELAEAFVAGFKHGQRSALPLTTAAVESARAVVGRAGTRKEDA